jgi:hypothetical protein
LLSAIIVIKFISSIFCFPCADDDYPRRSSSRKGSKIKRSKSRKMELIPWKATEKKGIASGLKDRLGQFAKQGQSAYKEVYRRAKVQ